MPKTIDIQNTNRVLEWGDLALILAICRNESLAGAARSLGKTHSTIFRNINAIEERTGVRFFDRFDHGYIMTDAGRTAMEYAERVEKEFHGLGMKVLGQDDKLSGRIRISCPDTFATEHAPGIVNRFVAEHPDIHIDISPGHGAVDLGRREAEIVIRATKRAPESSFGRKICPFRIALYSTEKYMAAALDTVLAEHKFCLVEGMVAWLVPTIWKTVEQGENQAVFQCSSARSVQNATALGMGITALPCYAGDADERLIRVSDSIRNLDMELWVLTHPDLQNTARIRAMMSFLYEELGMQSDLWGGERKSPKEWNFITREAT